MEPNERPTQTNRVLQYMKDFGSITQWDALRDLGVMRLASRVSELRKNGVNIESDFITIKNGYGEKCNIKRYYLGKGATA